MAVFDCPVHGTFIAADWHDGKCTKCSRRSPSENDGISGSEPPGAEPIRTVTSERSKTSPGSGCGMDESPTHTRTCGKGMANLEHGDAEKLRALADWHDKHDKENYYGGDQELQATLHRIADALDGL